MTMSKPKSFEHFKPDVLKIKTKVIFPHLKNFVNEFVWIFLLIFHCFNELFMWVYHR